MSPIKVCIFGDEAGLKQVFSVIPKENICAVVTAFNRPAAADWVKQSVGETYAIDHLVQPAFNRRNYKNFVTRLKQYRADLVIVNSYSLILRPDILTIPPLGAINVHGGLLPHYRGANVLNWVLVNGERETGVTLHYMDEGIDTGDIIIQKKIPIGLLDTAFTLRGKLHRAGCELLSELWSLLEAGAPIPCHKQDDARAAYYRRRKPEDGRIDWSLSEKEIYNLVRALVKPWPGAFYHDKTGKKVVIDEFLNLEKVAELKKDYLPL